MAFLRHKNARLKLEAFYKIRALDVIALQGQYLVPLALGFPKGTVMAEKGVLR